MARLTQIIHGSLESPLQVLTLMVSMGKGYIELPWEESAIITDKRGNQMRLGQIGMMSLILSSISLLKASVEVMELKDTKDKINGAIFSLVNLCFRLPALALIVIYMEEKSIGLFALLLLVNVVIFTVYKGFN